jgi:hypothetical protein
MLSIGRPTPKAIENIVTICLVRYSSSMVKECRNKTGYIVFRKCPQPKEFWTSGLNGLIVWDCRV